MPSRAWVKEQPNVTSARGGTRVGKALRHRPQAAFEAAVVEVPISLLPAHMEAAVHLIIADCYDRDVTASPTFNSVRENRVNRCEAGRLGHA